MRKLHFIGIGGIGMSGLAAMCRDRGDAVTGSDRGAARPENRRILDALEREGIRIFPQDGSFMTQGVPDALVYSSAIEADNADFAAADGIVRLHRSQLLAELIETLPSGTATIAVTGSCGKSSVTGYTIEALENLGLDPVGLNGALSKRFRGGTLAGNFKPGRGKYFVFEADESDKSLLNYSPDYAIVLNMGCDHYDKEELIRVFGCFLRRVKRGAVLSREVYEAVQAQLPQQLEIAVFDAGSRPDARYAVESYSIVDQPDGRRVPSAHFTGCDKALVLPQIGFHTALNALSILALLEMLGIRRDAALGALAHYEGVWRRNDLAGSTATGAAVYDDYAHNPEKILNCLRGMHELASGKVLAVFQPHGYGPFGFMRDQLFAELESALREEDRFLLLEPYYAGGTTSFKPTSAEVCADWRGRTANPERYQTMPDRDALRRYLLENSGRGDVIVIMGARDNSLSDYAKSLCRQE